jgi:lysozyme
MDVTEALAVVMAMCLHFEGLYLRPYLCPAGVPTIGVGSTRYLDGRAVSLADPPITREHASDFQQRVARVSTFWVGPALFFAFRIR